MCSNKKYTKPRAISNLFVSVQFSTVLLEHMLVLATLPVHTPLERQRLLGRSHLSLMWAVSVMAIQQHHKKPSLSLDPRMRSVALGQSTNNC